MKKLPSIKKNYIYSFLYQILSLVTPIITTPYVARVLGAEGIGVYSYTSSYMTYFTLMASLGTASYGMREIARCRDNKEEYSKKFWEIELITVFTSFICLLIWILLIVFSSKYKSYFIALIPSLFATMLDISWFYTGHEKIGYTVFWNAICKIAGVICIFLFINEENDLIQYIFLNSLVLMIGNISMWIFLPKMLIRVSPRNFKLKKHFRETIIYFIPTIATTIYTVLDKTLIGLITKDDYQNGYYEQATKIINIAKTLVFVSVNNVMGSRISYLFYEKKIDEIKLHIEKSLNFIFFLGFAVTFGIISVAKDFVPLFFGEGYDPVINLMYWMAPLILIIGVSNCLGSQYYTPVGLRAQSSKYIIIGAVTNLIMNLILIPKMSATGAVIGSIVAELTITILYLKNCNGFLKIKQVWLFAYKRLIAGIVMTIFVRMLDACPLSELNLLILKIIMGILIYLACLFIIRDSAYKDIIDELKKKGLNNG